MEEGLGPCVVAAVGRAEPAVFRGWGARRFLVDIWGLAESLVPAYTNSSIFCEKLRSGDAGERDSVSGERGIFCPGAGERIVCLVSGALALVFPVTVMCCPGFPGCFPESRPWVLSLGAVVIRHSLHVMSSVGRAQPGCPWAVLVLAVWRYQNPCGILQPHNDSEAARKSCGHSYSVQVSVWVDLHTPLKDDGVIEKIKK